VKIGPVDLEIALLKVKKKKLMQAKYIARSASVPSGLNNFTLQLKRSTVFPTKIMKIHVFQHSNPDIVFSCIAIVVLEVTILKSL